jgi:ribose/xylose/arabinose/galactoside ABC-type transport system permease subunit
MKLLRHREALLGLAILVLLGIVAARFPAFVTPGSLANVFNDTSPLILLAIGQMIVILTRCIDLSVAANLALTGMVAALLDGAGHSGAAGHCRRALPGFCDARQSGQCVQRHIAPDPAGHRADDRDPDALH